MECVLFRHGIATDGEAWDGPDAERPLTPKGVEKTAEACRGLARLKIDPTHLFSSPFVRARQTAQLLQEVCSLDQEICVYEELRPDATPDDLVRILARLPQDTRVVCVGHQPQLGHVAGMALFGGPVMGLALKKAGACCLRFDGAVKSGEGRLRWWLLPSQLRHFANR